MVLVAFKRWAVCPPSLDMRKAIAHNNKSETINELGWDVRLVQLILET
jgi:hypothetical protein